MKRDYESGNDESPMFFLGNEIEHTPAYGLKTLFVVGLQHVDDVTKHLHGVEHIFFGANHSYNPSIPEEHFAWEEMIYYFLKKDYLCCLDIPINQVEEFNDGVLCEFNNFIPQIRVPIPYVKLWNYNTMVKIDDKGFNISNPGVWTHSLHKLMNRENFTSWDRYKNDKVIK